MIVVGFPFEPSFGTDRISNQTRSPSPPRRDNVISLFWTFPFGSVVVISYRAQLPGFVEAK